MNELQPKPIEIRFSTNQEVADLKRLIAESRRIYEQERKGQESTSQQLTSMTAHR